MFLESVIMYHHQYKRILYGRFGVGGLDKTVPDEPQTPGYTYMIRTESNSLIHMTPLRAYHCPTSLKEEMKRTESNRLIHTTPLRAYHCPTSLKEEMKRTEPNSLIHITPLRAYYCPTSLKEEMKRSLTV